MFCGRGHCCPVSGRGCHQCGGWGVREVGGDQVGLHLFVWEVDTLISKLMSTHNAQLQALLQSPQIHQRSGKRRWRRMRGGVVSVPPDLAELLPRHHLVAPADSSVVFL